MQRIQKEHTLWFIAGLVLVGIAGRLGPHPYNFTPLTAIALFAGSFLGRKNSLWIPMAILFISNLFIGWHDTLLFVMGAFALVSMIGWWVGQKPQWTRIISGVLASSTVFYLITNFAVWFMHDMYAKSAQGLWHCYVAGIPYYRNMLMGDVVYSGVLFGAYAIASQTLLQSKTARNAA